MNKLILTTALTVALCCEQALALDTTTYGIVVNLKLRNAMQEAMVAGGVLPANCVGMDTEGCMPSLTSAQITSIFAQGHTSNWDDLRYDPLPFTPAPPHSIYQIATSFPSAPTIHICSRTSTPSSSGLAMLNVIFENSPCIGPLSEAIPAAATFNIQKEPINTSVGKFYHSMPSDGELAECLEILNNGYDDSFNTNWSDFVAGVNGDGKDHRWAIGFLPAYFSAGEANNRLFRFIKIDGVSPSSHNVVEGRYPYWMENGEFPAPTCVTQLWGGLVCGLYSAGDSLHLPTYDAPIPPGTPGCISAGFDPLRPVNPYTRATGSGTALNNCRMPSIPNGTRAMPVFYQ